MSDAKTDLIEDAPRTFFGRVLLVLGLTALVLVAALLVWTASEIFLLAFAGILVALFLNTPARLISSRTPIPHGLALLITIAVLFAAFVGVAWYMGPRIVTQANELIEQIPSSLAQVRENVEGWPGGSFLVAVAPSAGAVDLSGAGVISRVTGTVSMLWDGVAKLVFVLFLALFLASAPRKYRDGVVRLFPKPRQDRALEVLNALGRTLQGWLGGQLVAMILVGVVTAVGLSLIGIPLALILGIIAGSLEFIPIIGPFVAFVPAVLLAFTQGTDALLWVIALYVLVQQLEGNVIVPLIQRRSVDLPPPLTIGAVFVGGAAFGVLGLLIATPLLAVVMVLVKMLYLKEVLHQRVELPGDRVEGGGEAPPARTPPRARS